MEKRIYTIGHSNHSIEYFLELLLAHGVNCVVDVRSIAASRFNPQYNKKALQNFLSDYSVEYLHFDKEFGARRTEPELFGDNGQVDFDKVQKSQNFAAGVERLGKGIEKGFTIALMCAEADPLDCHRFSMISSYLYKKGFRVLHILKDKSLMTNEELETALLYKYRKKLSAFRAELFAGGSRLEAAFKLKNAAIGYKPDPNKMPR
jgi:uncharacterized protein (DUF488 family)